MNPEKILLVDDEPDIRNIARLALTRWGRFTVTTVDGGEEAVSAALSEQPDLLLLDVMMPRKDGVSVANELRARGVQLPLVFLTARARRDDVERYFEVGALGVIVKPFEPVQLCREVKRFLALAGSDPQASPTAPALYEDPEEQLRSLQREYALLLPPKVRELADATRASASGSSGSLRRAHELAHRLLGTAGSFGFGRVGELAGTLESRLELLLEEGNCGRSLLWLEVEQLLTALSAAAEREVCGRSGA